MKTYAFNNESFDTWLNEKTLEIISKDLNEPISNRDCLVLILKSQLQSFENISNTLLNLKTE